MLQELICPNCRAKLKLNGAHAICVSCGSEYLVEIPNIAAATNPTTTSAPTANDNLSNLAALEGYGQPVLPAPQAEPEQPIKLTLVKRGARAAGIGLLRVVKAATGVGAVIGILITILMLTYKPPYGASTDNTTLGIVAFILFALPFILGWWLSRRKLKRILQN